MKKHTLSIGFNDQYTHKQEIETETALQVIKDSVMNSGFDGATIIPGAIGIFRHSNGAVVVENSVQVVFYGAEPSDVKALASRLRAALNQESVAYEEQEIYSEFIEA